MNKPNLPKGPISADELARLKAEMLAEDPDYRRKVEAVHAERSKRARLLRESEQPIISDLRQAGVNVDSVWDLVNTGEPYPAALPVLVQHLERGGYPDRVMESLGRALAVKPSIAWWERLKTLYLKASDPSEMDGLAVALAACATKNQINDLIGFLSEPTRGDTPIYFLRPIKRLGGDAGRELLESLREDETLGREATALLGRSRKR